MNPEKSILADIDNEASDSESVVPEMPSRAVTPNNFDRLDVGFDEDKSKPKPKRVLRPISEEQKVKMQMGRAAAKLRRDAIYQKEKLDLEKKMNRLQLLELVDQETLQEAMNIIALKKNAPPQLLQTPPTPVTLSEPENPGDLVVKPVVKPTAKKAVRKPRVSKSQLTIQTVKASEDEQGYNTDSTDTSFTTSYTDSEADDSLHGFGRDQNSFRSGLTASNHPQFNPLSIYGKR